MVHMLYIRYIRNILYKQFVKLRACFYIRETLFAFKHIQHIITYIRFEQFVQLVRVYQYCNVYCDQFVNFFMRFFDTKRVF